LKPRNAPPGGQAQRRSSGGSNRRVPGLSAREHGVEDDDQLAHAGDQSDLGFLATSKRQARQSPFSFMRRIHGDALDFSRRLRHKTFSLPFDRRA